MDPLLEPPEDSALALPEVEFEASPTFRVHEARYGAVYFNPAPSYRFNAPAGEYGVMYVSASPQGALAETLLSGRRRPPVVEEAELRLRALSRVHFPRKLRLVDFAERGLARLGLDGRIAAGDCYALARLWSKWIHDHPQAVDGILYHARNAPGELSVALFERPDLGPTAELLEASLSPAPGRLSVSAADFVDSFGVAVF